VCDGMKSTWPTSSISVALIDIIRLHAVGAAASASASSVVGSQLPQSVSQLVGLGRASDNAVFAESQ
jgi:hypothetical protein